MIPTSAEQEHEAGLARFVIAAKRERIGFLLATKRGRRKLVQELPHFRDWDGHAVVPLAPPQQTPPSVLGELRRLGAPAVAYVLSAASRLDARSCPLSEAVRDVVGSSSGTVISCLPGRLAFYEGEGPGDRCILLRRG